MTYRTIVADPPWDYPQGFIGTNANGQGRTVRRPLPYPSMSSAQIADIRPAKWAHPKCNLFLWTTNRYLPAAIWIVDAWGFKYRHLLVWHKTPRPLTGGIAPTSLEFLIYATRGEGAGLLGRLGDSMISTKRLANSHSRKPDVWLDEIERVSPGPYLELFARRQRLGWDTWGNEALEHVEMPA